MQQIDPIIFSKQTYHFYVAAYFANFTKAADYLGIDQSAISHSVKFLEKKLASKLFSRQHRGVKLTDNGRILFESLQISQTSIGVTLDEIKNKRHENHVSLSMSNATATVRILPKLAYFKARHPDIEISCIVSNSDQDLAVNQIDLAIPLSLGPWRGCQQWVLDEEIICAVASPAYVGSLSVPVKTPYDLARERLIHLNEQEKTRFDWHDWLTSFDKSLTAAKPTIDCNDYSIVLQMAMDGQGIALGWNYLVQPLIEQGKLVKVIPHEVKTGHDFHLITKHSNPLPTAVELLKDWIVNEVFSNNPLNNIYKNTVSKRNSW